MRKRILASAIILASLVWGAWVIAVPEEIFLDAISGPVKRWGLNAEPVGFRKGLFYSFTMEGLDIGRSGVKLFSLDGIRGGLELSSLPLLKLAVPFEGEAGGGVVRGRAVVKGRSRALELSVRDARLEESGIFELTGMKCSGRLSADLGIKDGAGEARFRVDDLVLDPVALRGFNLPLNMLRTARGAILMEGGHVEIKSLALEGIGIYARITGSIKGREMEAKVELMPDEEAMPDVLLSAAMGRYRVSRGYYVIPIKRKLAL
jgi:type II secretion system protein N